MKKDHVQQVLERLPEFELDCKTEKCQFGLSEVSLFGFVMISEGVGMESDRISTIEDWPTPKAVRDVQLLVEFANFYRRFITKYAKVTTPISNLLKTTGSPKWEWT
jgi:hypothetical protein